jgi:hypothetical protein
MDLISLAILLVSCGGGGQSEDDFIEIDSTTFRPNLDHHQVELRLLLLLNSFLAVYHKGAVFYQVCVILGKERGNMESEGSK